MAWASQLAATCHALVALGSFRIGLDGNITLWGRLAALLSQGALLLRTVIQLALGDTALSSTLCGWCGCTGLLANSVLVSGMAYTIQKTLAGLATSRQTTEAVLKIVQHCGSGISYFTTTWFALMDQSYASLVLPEWGVIMLAEVHYASAMILHAVSLPGQSMVIHAVILQLCMILFPWLLRRHLLQQGRARTVQSQPKAAHACSMSDAAGQCSSGATCASAAACAQKITALAPAGTCSIGDVTARRQEPSGQAALQAAKLLVSTKGKEQRKPARYVSVLGPAIQPMCLKIDTPLLEPEHLPVDAPQLLATALAHASARLGDEMLMLGMSVRRGCILIAVQTFQPGWASMDTDRMQKAVRMSEELLPRLLTDLGFADDAHELAQLMGPGTSMSLQQGTQLVQAKYEPAPGKWDVAPQPNAFSAWMQPGSSMSVPQLGLVVERRGAHLERMSSVSHGSSNSSSFGLPGASGTYISAAATHATNHRVVLEVAVACGVDATSLTILGGAGAQMHGKPAGADAEAGEVDDPSVLQLCALGEGGYLPARVMQRTASMDGTSTIIKVEVQLHASGLVHHHPGGPCAAIQPLCLQLWCGKLLLSSSYVLLGLPPTVAALCQERAAGAIVADSGFGWWGTTADLVTAAAAELQAEVVQAAAAADPAATVGGYAAIQDLVRDVCYWLAGVQHMACKSEWCASAAPGSTQRGLPASTLLLLADSLCQYASDWRLVNLHNMIQRQRRLVTTLQQQAANAINPHGGTAATAAAEAATGSTWRNVWQHARVVVAQVHVALFGLACMQCEQLAVQETYTNLNQASMCLSCIGGLGTAVAIGRQPNPGKRVLSWLLALWALTHVGMCALRFLSQSRHATHRTSNQRAMSTLRILSLTSFITKLAMVFIVAVRSAQRLGVFTRQHKSGTWVLMHLHPVLADHMHLQSVLPQPIVTWLMLVEYVFFVFANKQVHGWVVSIAGTAGVVLLTPLLLQLYARARGSAAMRRATAAQAKVAPVHTHTQHSQAGKLKAQ